MKTIKRTLLHALLSLLVVSAIAIALYPAVYAAPENQVSNGKVKNVILMISDGCGYNHITATDYYQYGRAGQQDYERFPVSIAMSTYEYEKDASGNYVLFGYDPQKARSHFDYVEFYTEPNNTTDSASAATAMSTGVKTYNGAIGVDINNQPLTHAIQHAETLGKATGVITTVEFRHATPAGFVAHNVSRNNYAAIANEMLKNSAVDVIMGAGNPNYDDNGKPSSPSKDAKYVGGDATWADLTDADGLLGADADGDGTPDRWTLIQERSAFQALAHGPTPARVIGVPRVYTTLQQVRSGNPKANPFKVPLTASVPTLEEMTKAALNVLDNNPKGFFLMIEGGAIDWAAHANQSGRLIEEEMDFNKAVEAVVNWVEQNSNWRETLVIVTGDHETGHLTGPGSDPNFRQIVNFGKGNLPGMEWHSDEHTNSLIPFFARGDVARLFERMADERDPVRGPYIDNTEVAKVLFSSLK